MGVDVSPRFKYNSTFSSWPGWTLSPTRPPLQQKQVIRGGNNKCSHVHNMYAKRQKTHTQTCTYLNTNDYPLRTKRASPCRTGSYYLKHLFKQGGGEWWDEERDGGRERFCECNNALNGEENINRVWRQSQGHMQIQSKMRL